MLRLAVIGQRLYYLGYLAGQPPLPGPLYHFFCLYGNSQDPMLGAQLESFQYSGNSCLVRGQQLQDIKDSLRAPISLLSSSGIWTQLE